MKPWRICSWNVNGLRSAERKGFVDWLAASDCQAVGVQEVRAMPTQLSAEIRNSRGWNLNITAAEKPGYSGVGMFARREPDEVTTRLGIERFDVEGRFQSLRFGKLQIVNVYFPKGSGAKRDNSRVPYKLDFYRAVFDHVEGLRKKRRRVLVMGDYNTAHQDIDLARPGSNHKNSGFLPEERVEFYRWIHAGWIDTFRAFNDQPGHYSWWSQRFSQGAAARKRNVGWRIDYVLASPSAMRFVKDAFIWRDVMGSDHCPVGVTVDPAIAK